MRGRMAVNLKRLGILRSQDFESGGRFQWARQVIEFPIDTRYDGVVGQTITNRFCNVNRPAAGRNNLLAAIRQGYGKALTHLNFRVTGDGLDGSARARIGPFQTGSEARYLSRHWAEQK